jgi:hypothetical protein
VTDRLQALKAHLKANPRSIGQSGIDGKELLQTIELLEEVSADLREYFSSEAGPCPCLPCQKRAELSQKMDAFFAAFSGKKSST